MKPRHEKATSRPLQDDLLVTMMVNKTQGTLQQHLRLNVGDLTAFDEILEIVKNYYQSRLANWKHMLSSHDTSGPMDIGALKGQGSYKGFGKGFGKGFNEGKGKKGGKGKGNFKGTWKGKGTGNWKGQSQGKKGKGKGQGKGTGCFICGSHSLCSGECSQKHVGAIVEDALESKDDDWSWNWNEDWNDEQGWNEDDWTGAVVDDTDWTYGDWSWYESE